MDVYTHTLYPKFNNDQLYKYNQRLAPSCFPEDLSKGNICIVEIHLLLSSNDQPNPLVPTELVDLGP